MRSIGILILTGIILYVMEKSMMIATYMITGQEDFSSPIYAFIILVVEIKIAVMMFQQFNLFGMHDKK